MEPGTHYIGDELELFSTAVNWKSYWGNQVRPFLGKNVLEVGSGLGGTTKYLIDTPGVENWVCLEPDARLTAQAKLTLKNDYSGRTPEFKTGYLSSIRPDRKFSSMIYADVIEHIENDGAELQLASSYLEPGGHLIIVVPAHQFLFSEFDRSIGHFRRYSRKSLTKVLPASIQPVFCRYLDAAGMLASLSNKMLLRQNYPTAGQVKFWDTAIVPVSTFLDKLVSYNLGKSVLFVGKKLDYPS